MSRDVLISLSPHTPYTHTVIYMFVCVSDLKIIYLCIKWECEKGEKRGERVENRVKRQLSFICTNIACQNEQISKACGKEREREKAGANDELTANAGGGARKSKRVGERERAAGT